jgi:hypothetical protein
MRTIIAGLPFPGERRGETFPKTSGTVKATIVAEYIVERLAAEGIDH